MPLYLIEHAHTTERCPAGTSEGMKMMIDMLVGREHASRTGVKVVAEYALVKQHRLLVVVEAPEKQNVENFAQPLRQVGSVQIYLLTTCAEVMAAKSRGCA